MVADLPLSVVTRGVEITLPFPSDSSAEICMSNVPISSTDSPRRKAVPRPAVVETSPTAEAVEVATWKPPPAFVTFSR